MAFLKLLYFQKTNYTLKRHLLTFRRNLWVRSHKYTYKTILLRVIPRDFCHKYRPKVLCFHDSFICPYSKYVLTKIMFCTILNGKVYRHASLVERS